MKIIASSSQTIAESGTTAVDQAIHSSLFRIPYEIRMEIYSHLFTKAVLHVEAVHPYHVEQDGVTMLSETWMSNEQKQQVLNRWERERGWHLSPHLHKHVGVFLHLGTGRSSSDLFKMYRCTSGKSFESASACPPGVGDHRDCGQARDGAAHAFPSTCRSAYFETRDHVRAFKSDSALQFASEADLEAFSMLLTVDQREGIRDIRLNLLAAFGTREKTSTRAWKYFCNVFATPWDRRSILHERDACDYPNYRAKITFRYNYNPAALPFRDPTWKLPLPKVDLEGLRKADWRPGTAIKLARLRARTPLSVRFAIPRFLSTASGGQSEDDLENDRDDLTNNVLEPGDDGCSPWANRDFTESMGLTDLLVVKRRIPTSASNEEKEELQGLYNEEMRHYWDDARQPRSGPFWLRPLQQCQHFEFFDVDFYDEDGPRTSLALEVVREALIERFTALEIGPHPCLVYNTQTARW